MTEPQIRYLCHDAPVPACLPVTQVHDRLSPDIADHAVTVITAVQRGIRLTLDGR